MAGKNGAAENTPTEKAAPQGQSSPPPERPPGPPPSGTEDTNGRGGAPDPRPSAQEPADQSVTSCTPQASSLSHALYLWLSKRPAWLQNIILVGFALCTLLLFFSPVVAVLRAVWEYLPRSIPPIQVVICNPSDQDADFSTTGDFTIWTPAPEPGKLDLKLVEDIVTPDSSVIHVPRGGERVRVEATIRQPRKFYEYYSDGGCPLTMVLAADTMRTATRIDPFSRANLKKQWLALIPSGNLAGRAINVCFDVLDHREGLLRDETRLLVDDLTDEVRRDRFFGSITPEYFDEIRRGDMAQVPSSIDVKVAVAIYEDGSSEDRKKAIRWEVSDTRGKLHEAWSRWYGHDTAAMEAMVISYVTQAIRRSYPITGRMREVLGAAESAKDGADEHVLKDGVYVEIGIGRLAGVREGTTLHVYCGEIARDKMVGDVEITATWTDTCEGRLTNWSEPCAADIVTSFLVSSGVPE